MKHCTLRAALVALLLPHLLGGCGDSAEAREVRDSLGRTLDATKALAIKTWQDLQRESGPMLATAQQQFAELQKRLESGGQQVGQQARDAMVQARRQLDEAAKAVESSKNAGADSAAKAWQSFREALGHAHDSLLKAAAALGEQPKQAR